MKYLALILVSMVLAACSKGDGGGGVEFSGDWISTGYYCKGTAEDCVQAVPTECAGAVMFNELNVERYGSSVLADGIFHPSEPKDDGFLLTDTQQLLKFEVSIYSSAMPFGGPMILVEYATDCKMKFIRK